MKFPMVSVVMSVFNGKAHMKEAVDSILNQTFSDFEFIIVDDDSTDGSSEILDKYSKKDERIKIIHQKNTGLTKALNIGISQAQGEFIARMDDDDVSLPDRFEKELEYLNDHPDVALVSCFAKVINEKGEIVGEHKPPIDHETIKKMSFFSGQICHPAVMFRKKIFDELGGYNEKFRYAQDYELWFRFIGKSAVANIPDFLFLWRASKHGISSKNKNEQRRFAQRARAKAIKSGIYPFYFFVFMLWPYVSYLMPRKIKMMIKNKV